MDANITQGLDQLRQSLPGSHSSHPDSHASSGPNSHHSSGKSSDDGHVAIKQEPVDSLVGLGLDGSDPAEAQPDETYHRKRTKSVDMYSNYMGSVTSFNNPPMTTTLSSQTVAEIPPTGMTSSPSQQGTSVHNWQPPDLALHLQVYQNNMHMNGLVSALPPASLPMHMQQQMGHGYHMMPGPMGQESNMYHMQNMGDHVLRHASSQEHLEPTFGLPPTITKTKGKTKGAKTPKGAKAKGRSMSMGDALDVGEHTGDGAAHDDDESGAHHSGEETGDFEGSEIHGDRTARKQKLRFEGDQYTPQWVRNTGQAKEGFCDTCSPGKWLQLKNSAFW